MNKGQSLVLYGTLSIVGSYFLFLGLSKAQTFLIPLTTAVILALLMLPLVRRMERVLNNMVASLLNTFILLIVSLGFLALVSYQVKSFADDWPKIKSVVKPKIEQITTYLSKNTPIPMKKFKASNKGKQSPFLKYIENPAKRVASVFSSTVGFMATYLLTLIYVFFFLNYREHFKKFLLRLFPEDKESKVKSIIHESAKKVQQYILGKLLVTLILAVFYAIGLGISGVQNFIVLSILCAFLNLIPYIGNIVGFGMAMAFGYLVSGEEAMLFGIIITFVVAQFIESYILEPYVVGNKVRLHPFFIILAVIVGNMVWGIMGMILAIPILAMINVIFLLIVPLHFL